MRMFDMHTHIGTWKHSEYREYLGTLDDLSSIQQRGGFSGAVVMPSDMRDNESLIREISRKQLPRVYFFPWVNPKDEGIGEFLDVHKAMIAGLKFSSSYDRIPGVTDRLYAPYVAWAVERDVPVLIHCGRWLEMAGYGYALDLAKRNPRLRIICAHLGGVDERLQRAALERVHEEKLGNVWFDTAAVLQTQMLSYGIRLIGPERFCFGSDYPLYDPMVHAKEIAGMSGEDDIKQKVLYTNAARILGIEKA